MQPKLAIVIPCYNEEAVLPITSRLFREQLERMIREEEEEQAKKVAQQPPEQPEEGAGPQDAAEKEPEEENKP